MRNKLQHSCLHLTHCFRITNSMSYWSLSSVANYECFLLFFNYFSNIFLRTNFRTNNFEGRHFEQIFYIQINVHKYQYIYVQRNWEVCFLKYNFLNVDNLFVYPSRKKKKNPRYIKMLQKLSDNKLKQKC